MARSVDVVSQSSQAQGIDMRTMARKTWTAPSLANGIQVTAIDDGTSGAGSPGAVLGTGANVDLYTPGIEAV
jgi:hypothetical protein